MSGSQLLRRYINALGQNCATTGAQYGGHFDYDIFEKVWMTEEEADAYSDGLRIQDLLRDGSRRSVQVHSEEMSGLIREERASLDTLAQSFESNLNVQHVYHV